MFLRFLFFFLVATTNADQPSPNDTGIEITVRTIAKLKLVRPDLRIEHVEESPIENIYVVHLFGGAMLHTSADGEYLIAGDMYKIGTDALTNLATEKRNRFRRERLEKIDLDDFITFPPQSKVEATVSVFTDVDCGYCRQLHKDLPRFHAYGIEIRYLAYPRGGVGSETFNQMVSAWCADDPQEALTILKNGENIPARDCDNPVTDHYELALLFASKGTPVMIMPDGELVTGYQDADLTAEKLGLISQDTN